MTPASRGDAQDAVVLGAPHVVRGSDSRVGDTVGGWDWLSNLPLDRLNSTMLAVGLAAVPARAASDH